MPCAPTATTVSLVFFLFFSTAGRVGRGGVSTTWIVFWLQGAPSSQHGSPRRLLSTRRRLSTLDSQLFHSRPRLALDSRNSRSGYRLCGQRGLEFDCGLRKGLFDGRNHTTTRFIVCDPPASSYMVLRSGTRDPNQSPSSTRAPSPGHLPAVVPTPESD